MSALRILPDGLPYASMHQTPLTWMRAAIAGALSFMLLVLAFLYIPHWILTALNSPSRDIRVWMATAWIAVALTVSCVVGWRATGARPPAP
jgi:hypothetical protein